MVVLVTLFVAFWTNASSTGRNGQNNNQPALYYGLVCLPGAPTGGIFGGLPLSACDDLNYIERKSADRFFYDNKTMFQILISLALASPCLKIHTEVMLILLGMWIRTSSSLDDCKRQTNMWHLNWISFGECSLNYILSGLAMNGNWKPYTSFFASFHNRL